MIWKKVRTKVFNWSEVHLYQSNFLQNPYFNCVPICIYRMLEVPHQNGFHPASCSSPLPSSHTPSPGLSNGSPGSNPAEVKNKSDFRPANLKVVIPNSTGPPQSHQQSGSLETGGLLGISRGHDDVSIFSNFSCMFLNPNVFFQFQ